MTFRFGGGSRRYRLLADDEVFIWKPGRRSDDPIFRDMGWDFEEPDQYPEVVAAQKPGMMASRGEKAFHAAVASGDPESILAEAGQNPKYGTVGKTIAGLLIMETSLDRGMSLLEEVIRGDDEVGKDQFARKYLPDAGLSVEVAAGVVVHLPLQRNSLILLVAELYQARDEDDRAIELLDGAEQTTHIRLSLAELLYESDQFGRVLDVTAGIHNDDDVTALMLAYRGRALTELDRSDEAIATLGRVLEYPNRAASIKAIALVGRGMIHQARGEGILAENDFTQALMEVPDDEEARRHVEEMIRGDSGGKPTPSM
jgi:tetratricopeptide (TPR) repeat protein